MITTHTTHAEYYTVQGRMPGYMPDADDPRATDFASALGWMVDELQRSADDLYERSELDDYYEQDERQALEEEGDRVHRIANALSETSERLQAVYGRPPASVVLEGEPYPLDYVRRFGLSVHVETEPESIHHLGWTIGLEPVPADTYVCVECGALDGYSHAEPPECAECGLPMAQAE